MLDETKFEEILVRYPTLAVVLSAGVVSLKMVREVLDIDRWLMQDLYKELMLAGAVEGTSSSCFRATKLAKKYLSERRVKVC